MNGYLQRGYHLYADLAVGVGASNLALKMADPAMNGAACPSPATDEQYVIHAIHVSVGGDTAFEINTPLGAIYKKDLPGGSIGDLVVPRPCGLPCGAGLVPRLTLGAAVACQLSVFATCEKVSGVGAGIV